MGPKIANVYKILYGATGYLGGNGAGGAIYGEITQGSMQVGDELNPLSVTYLIVLTFFRPDEDICYYPLLYPTLLRYPSLVLHLMLLLYYLYVDHPDR